MSAETLLTVGAAPAPSAAPSASLVASLGSGSSGGAAAGGSGAESGGASNTGVSNASLGGQHGPQPAPSGATHAADGGPPEQSKTGGARTRAAQSGKPGKAAKPAVPQAPTGQDFSQTLAQSLAAPAHAGASAAASTGKLAKSAVPQGPDKARKSDPVSAAMAMMSHSVPMLLPPPAQTDAAKGASASKGTDGAQPAKATGIESSGAASSAERKRLQTEMLAQSAAADGRAPEGPARQGPSPAAGGAGTLNSAAALTAGQFAAGAHAATQTPLAAMSAALSAPVGSSGWTGQLGAQLTWMARQGVQSASLQVSPQHLGPVQVSISVHRGQASVWFGAAQAETRQALTQALPQLRAMFANQGLTLTDSGVSRDAPRDPRRPARAVAAMGETDAPQGGAGGPALLTGTGLLDTYA